MNAKKTNVVFRGPVLTHSGYGVHSRQVAKWLLQRDDVNVRFVPTPWGDTPWIINKSVCDGMVGAIMEKTSPHASKPDISFQLQLPNEWDPNLANINVGMTAGVETDRCNPEWVTACNKMQHVIVPSQHAKAGFVASGKLDKEIEVIPESFNEAIDLLNPGTVLENFPTSFNFLIFGQLTGNNPLNDRKNTFFTIKWLCEAFKNDPDVGIVIKTNAGRNTKIDRILVTNLIKQFLAEVRKGPGPKVYLMHGDMNDNEVASLYRHPQIKALVALTRGEGYGLPILEAAASNLPIIATGWSGHMDFLKHGRFVNITYQLGEIHPSRVDNKIFMQGSRWANPSEEDFKRRVLKFKESSSTPKEWANALGKQVTERYKFENIKLAYDSFFESIKPSV